MSGIFSRTSPDWLLEKLISDLQAMENSPHDSMKAFDFFVTAESWVDWIAPGKENEARRKKLREQEVLLQIVSHLASSAKHFKVEASHHQSVNATRQTAGLFSGGLFRGRLFAGALFSKGGLFVELSGEAGKQFGTEISAIALAEKVLARLRELMIQNA